MVAPEDNLEKGAHENLSPDPLSIGDRRPMKNVATLCNGSGVKSKVRNIFNKAWPNLSPDPFRFGNLLTLSLR